MTNIVELLAKTRMFGSLSQEILGQVYRQMRPIKFNSGQLIFERGDPGRDIYLVTAGRVRISVLTADGRELSFGHPGSGEIFGEVAALDGGPRTPNATALTKVETMALSRSAFGTLLETHPALGKAAIAFTCSRLREADLHFESVALQKIEARVARFLLILAQQQYGQKNGAKPAAAKGPVPPITLGLSQGELGLYLGASRPKINAALKLLEANEAITREGERIVCDCIALAAIAAEE
jgi:CRP/FNR family transcriptional regulator, cyclic AMP receptor protein